MKKPHYLLRYWLPTFFLFALSFYFSSLSPSNLPNLENNLDKVAHGVMYFALGLSLCRALTASRRKHISRREHLRLVAVSTIAVILWGISDEWHQSFVPGRTADVMDVLADAFGGLAGSLATMPYRRLLRKYL